MTDLNKMVDELSKLSVMEAAELSKLLQEKWGVSAAAPVAAAVPVGSDGGRRAGRGYCTKIASKLVRCSLYKSTCVSARAEVWPTTRRRGASWLAQGGWQHLLRV